MYKGLVPALPLTCHAALHWTIYERLKQLVAIYHDDPKRPMVTDLLSIAIVEKSKNLAFTFIISILLQNVVETFATASGSKLIASTLTYPLHVLKTCLQVISNLIA